jgi:hypothetical protein
MTSLGARAPRRSLGGGGIFTICAWAGGILNFERASGSTMLMGRIGCSVERMAQQPIPVSVGSSWTSPARAISHVKQIDHSAPN